MRSARVPSLHHLVVNFGLGGDLTENHHQVCLGAGLAGNLRVRKFAQLHASVLRIAEIQRTAMSTLPLALIYAQ